MGRVLPSCHSGRSACPEPVEGRNLLFPFLSSSTFVIEDPVSLSFLFINPLPIVGEGRVRGNPVSLQKHFLFVVAGCYAAWVLRSRPHASQSSQGPPNPRPRRGQALSPKRVRIRTRKGRAPVHALRKNERPSESCDAGKTQTTTAGKEQIDKVGAVIVSLGHSLDQPSKHILDWHP